MTVEMQVRAIYEDEVLKPLKKLDLPDKTVLDTTVNELESPLRMKAARVDVAQLAKDNFDVA